MKQCIRQWKAPFIFLGARREGPIFMVFFGRGEIDELTTSSLKV
jgi:hypothetical protein